MVEDNTFFDSIKLSSGAISDYVDTTKPVYYFAFTNDSLDWDVVADYAIIA